MSNDIFESLEIYSKGTKRSASVALGGESEDHHAQATNDASKGIHSGFKTDCSNHPKNTQKYRRPPYFFRMGRISTTTPNVKFNMTIYIKNT